MIQRFFVSQIIGDNQKITVKDGDLSRQISKVLRLKIGEQVVLLDNTGWEYKCFISELSKHGVNFDILEKMANQDEQKCQLILFQSVLKKDKMEWVFQKGTEVGIIKFIPVISEYSVKLGIDFKRSEKIIREAAEQSGGNKLPTLSDPVSFENAIEIAKNSGRLPSYDDCSALSVRGLNLLAHNIGDYVLLKDFCTRQILPSLINLFIGPEGGFSEEEVSLARGNGFQIVSLGKRILRAETAAIAASYFLIGQNSKV